MKKLFLLAVLSFAILSLPVFALSINVGVQKNYTGELKEISNFSAGNVRGYSVEFFNSGSLPYAATARLDIISDSNVISTSWSQPASLSPGDRHAFTLYSYMTCSGTYTARMRIYYANEIYEKVYSPETCPNAVAVSFLNVSDVAFGKDYIAFNARSEEAMNIIINGIGYLPGWKVYQKTASLGANTTSRLRLDYDADFVTDSPMELQIYSTSGNAFGSQTITVLTQEKAATNIIDSLLQFVSSFLHV